MHILVANYTRWMYSTKEEVFETPADLLSMPFISSAENEEEKGFRTLEDDEKWRGSNPNPNSID